MDAPLTVIRRLMLESNGLVTIAFKRSLIKDGIGKPQSDIGEKEYYLSGKWLTSPYCQNMPEFDLSGNLDEYFNLSGSNSP